MWTTLADIDWTAWSIAAATSATAVIGVIVAAMKDRRKTVVDEWIAVVNRHEQHIAQLQEDSNRCRSREMQLQRAVVYLHGVAGGLRDALINHGQHVDQLVPLDQLLPDDTGAEFRAKTLQQNTMLLHANAENITQTRAPNTPAGMILPKDGGPPERPNQ